MIIGISSLSWSRRFNPPPYPTPPAITIRNHITKTLVTCPNPNDGTFFLERKEGRKREERGERREEMKWKSDGAHDGVVKKVKGLEFKQNSSVRRQDKDKDRDRDKDMPFGKT